MKKRVNSDNRVKKTSSMYFDDCLICRSVEKADKEGKDLNSDELLEIFKRANEKN